METKICNKCKEEKDICEFTKDKRSKNGFGYTCKVCHNKHSKLYRDNNQEKIISWKELNKDYNKIYYENNKTSVLERKKIWRSNNLEKEKNYRKNYNLINLEKIKENRRIKNKIKYDNDFVYRIKQNIRTRINLFLKSNNIKKQNKTFDIVGCSPEYLKEYLEKQFINGMTWENRNDWHIDHIIPLSSAKTEDEVKKLCHYTNLQPLWAKDNLIKSNKIK